MAILHFSIGFFNPKIHFSMIFRAAKIHFSNELAKFLNQILLFLRIIIYCRKVHKKGKEIRKYFFSSLFLWKYVVFLKRNHYLCTPTNNYSPISELSSARGYIRIGS